MTIQEAGSNARRQLTSIYAPGEAASITDLLLESITALSKIDRIASKDRALNSLQQNQFTLYLDRLLQHEPIQYVLQKAWFYGMELFIDSNVLIPRPETEQLVQWVIEWITTVGENHFAIENHPGFPTNKLKILDMGTGSGCIALALKNQIPNAEIWACDNSEEALNVARRNGAQLDIRVDFQGLNFLDFPQQKQLPTVHIAVSNPPYIPMQNKGEMERNVVAFEPHAALFVQDSDPLVFYRSLAHFGKHKLYKGGKIFMEMHEGMGQALSELFVEQGYHSIEIRSDFQGKDRMISVTI